MNKNPEYWCDECVHVTFYDWYLCTHPEHPLQFHSKKELPFVYDRKQAVNCILFKKKEEN